MEIDLTDKWEGEYKKDFYHYALKVLIVILVIIAIYGSTLAVTKSGCYIFDWDDYEYCQVANPNDIQPEPNETILGFASYHSITNEVLNQTGVSE